MNSRKLTYIATAKLVESLVNEFNETLKVTVLSVTDNTDGTFNIYTCNQTHLIECQKVEIEGNEYEITEVNQEFFTVKGPVLPSIDTINLPGLKFFHGTPIMTAQELDSYNYSWDKLPMIYLYEKISDDLELDPVSCIHRTSNLRIFFLTCSNLHKWCTSDHYKMAIDPMTFIANKFIDFIYNHPDLGRPNSVSLDYHSNFTVHANVNGNIKKLFQDELSGVELSVNMVFEKTFKCDSCC